MKMRVDGSTAILAAAFGGMLIAADGLSEQNVTLDAKTAKELAIISRVLEKRLSDARASLSESAAARSPTEHSADGTITTSAGAT